MAYSDEARRKRWRKQNWIMLTDEQAEAFEKPGGDLGVAIEVIGYHLYEIQGATANDGKKEIWLRRYDD